jgi:sugar phosphate isomerase/epimerase
MRLGMVTYLWGANWDLPTLLTNCEQTEFEGVELRSTHAHGVEVTLTDHQREEVRKRFEDSPVTCVGLGSACEYHSPDPSVLKQNIELTKEFIVLSHDVGGTGVKVRPNGFNAGEEQARTIERIGKALRECGEFANNYGQELRLEVHGRGTQDPRVIRQIIDIADHEQVLVCWNSNPGEVVDGSIAQGFGLLRDSFSQVVHIHDLYDRAYPYRELFSLLGGIDYGGWCLSESPATTDPLKVMRYYRALWHELQRA